jgi:hypothetical protein
MAETSLCRYVGSAWKVLIVWRMVDCGNPALKASWPEAHPSLILA